MQGFKVKVSDLLHFPLTSSVPSQTERARAGQGDHASGVGECAGIYARLFSTAGGGSVDALPVLHTPGMTFMKYYA